MTAEIPLYPQPQEEEWQWSTAFVVQALESAARAVGTKVHTLSSKLRRLRSSFGYGDLPMLDVG